VRRFGARLAYSCVVQPTILPGLAAGEARESTSLVPDLYRIVRRLRTSSGSAPAIDVTAMMLLHKLGCDGSRRPSDLALEFGLDLSTVSRHVRTLEHDGLLAREPDPDDGRAHLVSLTAHGTDVMTQAVRRREVAVTHALAGWSLDDVAALHLLLGRLADDLDHLTGETS
jgi:DNA-binding MarR family transcriptional regulator